MDSATSNACASYLFQVIIIVTEIEIDISINTPELNSSSIIGSKFKKTKLNKYIHKFLFGSNSQKLFLWLS